MPTEPQEFDKHALRIGHICISWAHLETKLDYLLIKLIPVEGGEAAANVIVGNVDFREKLQMVLGLGFLKKPSVEWFNYLRSVLVIIDNELRPERNRHVHDLWTPRTDTGEILRRTLKTAIIKPQAFQTELSTQTITKISPEELDAFNQRIVHGNMDLQAIWFTFVSPRMHAAWLQDKPEQYLRSSTKENQAAQGGAVQPQQPRPTEG